MQKYPKNRNLDDTIVEIEREGVKTRLCLTDLSRKELFTYVAKQSFEWHKNTSDYISTLVLKRSGNLIADIPADKRKFYNSEEMFKKFNGDKVMSFAWCISSILAYREVCEAQDLYGLP